MKGCNWCLFWFVYFVYVPGFESNARTKIVSFTGIDIRVLIMAHNGSTVNLRSTVQMGSGICHLLCTFGEAKTMNRSLTSFGWLDWSVLSELTDWTNGTNRTIPTRVETFIVQYVVSSTDIYEEFGRKSFAESREAVNCSLILLCLLYRLQTPDSRVLCIYEIMNTYE